MGYIEKRRMFADSIRASWFFLEIRGFRTKKHGGLVQEDGSLGVPESPPGVVAISTCLPRSQDLLPVAVIISLSILFFSTVRSCFTNVSILARVESSRFEVSKIVGVFGVSGGLGALLPHGEKLCSSFSSSGSFFIQSNPRSSQCSVT